MLSKGQRINGRYEIVKSIGEGGMANVYLAVDVILNRNVAVKVLRGDLASDDKFIRRFQREAKSVSELSHPNIVEVYDVGEENGQHYIVMEYIEGKTLKQLIQKRGGLTVPEVVDIMSQLTDGLAHAHEAYIIHRDIKPQNIMILDNGMVKITDFGIAMALNATQLTQTNSVMGSVHYLPPEQAAGKSATVKSDIYSAGILMYELLTGSVPFKGDNAVEIALKQMKDKIPSVRKQDPSILQSVENIVIKACAKNPKNRYDSVKEMHEDLVSCLSKPDEPEVVFKYSEVDEEDTKVVPTNLSLDDSDDSKEASSKKGKRSKVINFFIISFIVLFVIGIGFCVGMILFNWLEPKEVKVPDVVDMSMEEAISALEEAGFTYTTSEDYSDEIEKGKVIKTSPKAGSTRKKGTTVTIVESLGSNSYLLEDLTGEDYMQVRALLSSTYGLNVNVVKKDVDNPGDYTDKENLIIGQEPQFNSETETFLKKGDTIVLYIPNVVNQYPDMVGEGWSVSDAKAFAEEYGISLDIEYEETSDVDPDTVIYQNRGAGSTIVSGVTLKIKVSKKPTEKPKDTDSDSSTSDGSVDNSGNEDE